MVLPSTIPSSLPRQRPPLSSVLAARAAGGRTGHRLPQIASAARTYLGLIKYHLSGVSANKSILPEIRHKFEVASRLAIFAVKKLSRFEREETRTV